MTPLLRKYTAARYRLIGSMIVLRKDTAREGRQSVEAGIDFGAVQDIIFYPVLFKIFIYDLHCYINGQCKVLSYFCDTVILNSAPQSQDSLASLRTAWEAISPASQPG